MFKKTNKQISIVADGSGTHLARVLGDCLQKAKLQLFIPYESGNCTDRRDPSPQAKLGKNKKFFQYGFGIIRLF